MAGARDRPGPLRHSVLSPAFMGRQVDAVATPVRAALIYDERGLEKTASPSLPVRGRGGKSHTEMEA